MLTDPLGRITPIHLELINSWEVFDAVISARFLNVPGGQKIERKEYAIQDRNSQQDIERSYSFGSSFLPGRCVDMAMIFRTQSSGASCPGCGLRSDVKSSVATMW